MATPSIPSREEAFALLSKYNKDPFHIRHALTVEGVMRWFAQDQGFADEADYWATVGLMHDIDFELYPDLHCQVAPRLLKEVGFPPEFIHSVCSHGYGICCDIEPTHQMEKILFAADELTGLIWAAALMRPSMSTKDMEVKSVKKKYKDHRFAAGCSREIIDRGCEQLGWERDLLIEKTILAMRECEDSVAAFMATYGE
ncbi:MAG: hydrolase [Coriobacteriales bacterium]|nr:hydrolase [Coriobacteriales bacterium]